MAATKGFMNHLSSAMCEWFLMFLMFINAALAYFLTKFAQHCELQKPCLFCLRLDHFFGNEEPESYLSLFCSKHQARISSLIACNLHDKLADVREMCEDCFMSITMQNQSNSESYRFTAGRTGDEGYQRSYLNKNFVRVPSSTGACSCCNRQWKAKSSAQRLIKPSPVGLGASKVTVKPPLPRVSGRSRFSRRDSFKRMRDKISGTLTQPQRVGNNTSVDTLSHVGYTELKITSDTESEFPFSEDEDASSAVMARGDKRGSQDDSFLLHGKGTQKKDKTPARHSHTASDPGPLLLLDVNMDESTISRTTSFTSNGSVGHGLGELNWAEFQTRPTPSPPALISLDDFPPSNVSTQNNAAEFSIGAAAERLSAVSAPSGLPDTDTTDQSKLSMNEREDSEPLKEVKDGSLPSTISTQEMDPSTNIRNDLSSSDENHVLQGSPLLDKSESGYESLDGGSVSEIEGEGLVETLKRQVKYDRKCLSSLQSELEEERNAAAIAANQAMAMITRLQEEKASLHMEALQYLRMMEEQAEYDMEALEKANDLVSEKEKEIQDLEAELELYRNHFDDEWMKGNVVEIENLQAESIGNRKLGANSSSDSRPMKALETDTMPMKSLEASNKPIDLNAPILDLDGEKQYISQWLSELERKFHQFCSRQTSSGMCNGNMYGGRTTNGAENIEGLQADGGTESDHLKDENDMSRHKDLSTSNGTSSTHDKSGGNGNTNHVDSHKRRFSTVDGEFDLSTFDNEISDLNERLEALEADRDFLEHACYALHNSGGLQFIQEIAHQLQDLRRIMFDRRGLSVT